MKNRKRLVSILAGIMAAVMILSLLMSILPTRVWAASSSEIRKQINALKEDRNNIKSQISELQEQYQATSDEISNMVAQKNVIDQEIGLLHEEFYRHHRHGSFRNLHTLPHRCYILPSEYMPAWGRFPLPDSR